MKFRCGDWEKAVNMGFFSVFPAQAGVILMVIDVFPTQFGIPRASGGDPRQRSRRMKLKWYSPRKRG